MVKTSRQLVACCGCLVLRLPATTSRTMPRVLRLSTKASDCSPKRYDEQCLPRSMPSRCLRDAFEGPFDGSNPLPFPELNITSRPHLALSTSLQQPRTTASDFHRNLKITKPSPETKMYFPQILGVLATLCRLVQAAPMVDQSGQTPEPASQSLKAAEKRATEQEMPAGSAIYQLTQPHVRNISKRDVTINMVLQWFDNAGITLDDVLRDHDLLESRIPASERRLLV